MFQKFLFKLKIPAFRDGITIISISLILIILALTIHWTEYVVNMLYKYQDYPLDDFILPLSFVSILLVWYAVRRNKEKNITIANQQISEAALHKTQDYLHVMLNGSASILYNTSASGDFRLLYMTENVTEILGYEKEEYYEPAWWFNNVHPDDKPDVQIHLAQLFIDGTLSCNYRFLHKNGTYVWMHSTSRLRYDADHQPIETIGTWWDITEEMVAKETIRQNNERMEMAFQATKDIIYDWDLVTNSLWMSDEVFHSCGYNKETSVIELQWWESKIHPDDHDAVLNDVMNSLKHKHNSWQGEYRFLCADNIYKNIFDRGFILYSEDGSPKRWVGSMSDISAAKQTETELRIAKDKAEESVKVKSEFLANMSHEIRTPLNGIIGMTELTLETDITPQQKRYLDNIHFSSDSLLSLINDILDFSKIDAGKMELSPVNFSLRDQLPKALQGLSIKAADKHIEFVFNVDENVPDMFFSDAARLQQVIVNLAGNAVKFTEKGEVVIQCALLSSDGYEAVVQFSVSDTGIGIPQQFIPCIFDQFTQSDSSISKQYGGTGLGLAISKKLVEKLGGDITVISKEGTGSTFSFTVKMKLQEHIIEKNTFSINTFHGKKVLIVEDNQLSSEYLTNLLRQSGMKVCAVTSGEDAIIELNKAVQENDSYRLVLLDISLAGKMTGFDVADEMQNIAALRQTGIIVISMSQNASDRERFGLAGVTQFFSKPYSKSQLLRGIHKIFSLTPALPGVFPAHTLGVVNKEEAFKILLVEDNIINQEVAYNMLTRFGYPVAIANNGVEAVAACEKNFYAVVFMDVQMPKMNGYDATRKIREIQKGVAEKSYIIGLTANAMKGDHEKCLEEGMDDYMSKPVRIDNVNKAMKRFKNTFFTEKKNLSVKKENIKPLINLEILLENLNEDEEAFSRIVRKLPAHLLKAFHQLQSAVQKGGLKEILFAAHSLKGLCLNFQIYKVVNIVSAIEELALEDNVKDIHPLISELEKEMLEALDWFPMKRMSAQA